MGSYSCICGFHFDSHLEVRDHHKQCSKWQAQLGVCQACGRRHYRHKPGCQNAGEDPKRRRLLQKYEIDPEVFQVFLRVLARRYRGSQIPL